MRKLVITNQWCAYLWVDIANHAAEVYDEVVLLAGHISELNTPLSKTVALVSMPEYSRQSLVSRWVSWTRGFAWLVWKLRTEYRGYEVLVSTNPPLATWLPLFVRNNCALYIMDLYPEALSMTGMVSRRNFFYRLWQRMNRAAYPRFSRVFAITHGMKEVLAGSASAAIDVIPLWSAGSLKRVEASSSSNAFVDEYDLGGKFLVVYSGNLGKEHDIDVLIQTAELLRESNAIQFLIIGQGWNFDTVEADVSASGLDNVLMLPFQDSETFQLVMSAAGLGVVAQSGNTASVCIPSKTFNILAYGLPVLALASSDSELAQLIERHGCGITCGPDQSRRAADFILKLSSDPAIANEYNRAAIEAAKNYSVDNARRLISEVHTAND